MRPPPLTLALPPGACPPPAELFPAFAARPGCAFLDTALPSAAARHSILACEPSLVLRGGPEILPRLRAELAARAVAPIPGLPFVGGAIGYLGYEYGASLDRVPSSAPDDLGLPDLAFAFYDVALVHDHAANVTTLVAPDADALSSLREFVTSPLPAPGSPPPAPYTVGPLTPDLSPAAYADAIARIRAYIAAGDTYQVNFTHRFTAPFSGSAAALHARLRALSPAPHAAYLDFGDFQLVSSTPERLLRVSGRALETRPIKGTVARLADPAADAAQRAALLASAKDHAELLMILDLARNDLGRVASPGTVHVAARHDLETYATVHHLVATVRAELAPGLDRFDALRALHPGGSITGAPKIRAMQIIAELEPARRHAYTGALGYLGYDGDADLAIAIRTITCARGRASYHVGGGITWDSDPAAEYEETLHKGRAMHAALTTSP
jgi:para-aminobenzoate synthetase component 1